ncbi:bacteriocin immunity protein [Companilactobacillus bobalius]|uniref:Bacteriocin immunity protein n=2 Tax=Companilactobacillus bobalius TaxID=2801451 RepID=A0A202FEU7_9LACO|nr:bacteriocin immunity protein [Companilactobacillus bobalius]KAE9560533.1 hypothetical protein ATN92_10315 [Companilactobacillus bobalius]KRK83301.1 hypothetical protein FC78_GL002111 [Companilactobacillus bobalius DSM 19674]OVE99006.1 hypothetical protein LKACC16343_00118 [Companilactobacillus bobalius]GEO56982.1 hypothetical protein LBO01_01110 [Companilactobacillus paralimentarius]
MNKTEKQRELREIDLKLLDRLEDAYNGLEVERWTKLKKVLGQFINELKNQQNIDQISSLICKYIASEYMKDSENFPKALIDLYYEARRINSKCEGIEWSATQAGLTWFERI